MTLLKEIQMEKSHTKILIELLRDTNTVKSTVLLSHLRNKYAFIVGYCC